MLTVEEAADRVGQWTGHRPPTATVRNWIRRGIGGVRLPSLRVGGRVLVHEAALAAFLAPRFQGVA